MQKEIVLSSAEMVWGFLSSSPSFLIYFLKTVLDTSAKHGHLGLVTVGSASLGMLWRTATSIYAYLALPVV